MIVECPRCKLRYDVTGRPPGTVAQCRCGMAFELPDPPQNAGGIGCPSCGAMVSPTNHACEFCNAHLKVLACPRCFARVFHESKFCASCGAGLGQGAARADADGNAVPLPCPRCEDSQTLVAVLMDDALMDECRSCHGVWIDNEAVSRIVADRREQAKGVAAQGRVIQPATATSHKRMYLNCPECETIMNRENFGGCSGVMIDRCKGHGTWFDCDELPQMIDFILGGGMEKADQRDAARAQEEARRARAAMNAMAVEAAMQDTQQRRSHGMGSMPGFLRSILSLLD